MNKIGEGAYAVVYRAFHIKTKEYVAIKLYKKEILKEIRRQNSIKAEIQILGIIDHPNVPKLIDCFATRDQLYLITEFVEGRTLFQVLKSIETRKLQRPLCLLIMAQLLSAISYCHSKQITHRDVKMENIILTKDDTVKLIDFGFSTCYSNSKKVRKGLTNRFRCTAGLRPTWLRRSSAEWSTMARR